MTGRWEANQGEHSPAVQEVRRRLREGDEWGAIELADEIALAATAPSRAGWALMIKLGCLINLGRTEDVPPLLDRAFEVLNSSEEHALLGGIHAMAAFVVSTSSIERGTRHLVLALRELERVTNPGDEALEAFLNVSVTSSYLGFHRQAVELADRTWQLSQTLDRPGGRYALVEPALRQALALDHCGDTPQALRRLRHLVKTWSHRSDPGEFGHAQRRHYGYALARLAVMGEPVVTRPELFLPSTSTWELAGIRVLAGACSSIAAGRASEALETLDTHSVDDRVLGPGEVPRLRALAYHSAGRYREASEADREAARRATAEVGRLRDGLLDGIKAQLDRESLRRAAEHFTSEAMTDPLTGLPNRRRFQQELTARRPQPAALGVVDLDRFKDVNTVHGHMGGDLVLQGVAAVLARAVRAGDFVARYGGDEFVLLLPDTEIGAAVQIGERLQRAVAAESWHSMVDTTPISITVGWAALEGPEDATAALERADRAMFAHKPGHEHAR